MFGRSLNSNEDGTEYLLFPPGVKIPIGTIEVNSAPEHARSHIEEEVLARHRRGGQEGYAVFELVEFVNVWDDEKEGAICIFSEDEVAAEDDAL